MDILTRIIIAGAVFFLPTYAIYLFMSGPSRMQYEPGDRVCTRYTWRQQFMAWRRNEQLQRSFGTILNVIDERIAKVRWDDGTEGSYKPPQLEYDSLAVGFRRAGEG
jgi:hypothetical protein